MAAAVADWHTTLSSKMVRVDTLFINTGDPGQSPPEKKGEKGAW